VKTGFVVKTRRSTCKFKFFKNGSGGYIVMKAVILRVAPVQLGRPLVQFKGACYGVQGVALKF